MNKFIKNLPQQALGNSSTGQASAGMLGLQPPLAKYLLQNTLKSMKIDAIHEALDEHDFEEHKSLGNPLAVGSAIMSGITLVEKLLPHAQSVWESLKSFKKNPRAAVKKAGRYLATAPTEQQVMAFVKKNKKFNEKRLRRKAKKGGFQGMSTVAKIKNKNAASAKYVSPGIVGEDGVLRKRTPSEQRWYDNPMG